MKKALKDWSWSFTWKRANGRGVMLASGPPNIQLLHLITNLQDGKVVEALEVVETL
jgi:hypothetical protein